MRLWTLSALFILSTHFSFSIFAAQNTKGVVSELEQAYQKEFAFLRSQKVSLEKQKLQIETDFKTKQEKAQKELNQLRAKLLAEKNKSRSLQRDLDQLQRNYQGLEDSKALIQNIEEQAKASLAQMQVEESEIQQISGLQESLTQTISALQQANVKRVSEGDFFDRDGKKVTGKILNYGSIAKFGVSETQSGALAPAGGGMFKIWPESDAKAAKDLLKGQSQDFLNIFLYENPNQLVEANQTKTWGQVLKAGGAIGYVILALGLFAIALIVYRARVLKQSSKTSKEFIEKLESLVLKGQIQQAQKLAESESTVESRVAKDFLKLLGRSREEIEDGVGEILLRESQRIDRFGSMIIVFASIAPLLGLLGTVTGMISTFDIITEFGTGDPKMLSGGISEALVTTKFGLVVAIPTLLLGTMLSGWAKSIKENFESLVLKLNTVYEESKSLQKAPANDSMV